MASSGNFCTMNQVDTGAYATVTGGNLIVGGTGSSTADQAKRGATFYVQSGKWYWEVRQTVGGSAYGSVGISVGSAGTATPTANSGFSQGLMYQSIAGTLEAVAAGYVGLGTVTTTSTGVSSVSNNQVINIALDMDNRKLWFGKDGTYFNSGNPASGSNPQFSWTTDTFVTPTSRNYATNRPSHYNFGQDSTFGGNETAGGNQDGNSHGDFHNSVPTGFLALCSANLPISDDIDPAQTDDDYPGKLFNVVTYTGNGSSQSITGLGFQPDLVWIKNRSGTQGHKLFDSSRGVTKMLASHNDDAETTESGLSAFGSDGFSLGGSTTSGYNTSSQTYVAWCWRCNGGTTASNTNGDITTTVQANQKAGFSIFTYTGNGGGAGTSMGHGLSQAPDIWFLKQRSNNGESSQKNWRVMLNTGAGGAFRSLSGSNQTLVLNEADAAAGLYRTNDNFEPTSTVVQAPDNGNANSFFVVNGNTYINYCWHSVPGYSSFGTYEGNGNNGNGPFVYTGFRPRLLFVKDLDAGNEWYVQDTARETHNVTEKFLEWDTSDAEQSKKLDILSNGFKPKEDSGRFNDTHTYIYGAWGDVPFRYNNTF